jgi:hypothetical protein
MGWKKALFLGGAVVLLAACDRATAPDTQLRQGGVPAAALKAPASKLPRVGTLDLDPDLCRGYYVRSGDAEPICVPLEF